MGSFFGILYIGLRLCRPDWCRDHSRGFTHPVFPALGTSVRLAASLSLSSPTSAPRLTVTTLSIYDWASSRGSNVTHLGFLRLLLSLLSLMIGVCVYVCERERERERNRTREGIWVYAREGWGEDSCVYDWFSEGVWEDRGWVRDRSPLLGVIKIAITAWEITACLLDTPHLYWVWQEIGARGIVCVGGYLYGQPAETTCKEHANWYSGQGCDSFPHSPLPHTHSFSVATAPSENFLDNRDEPVHNTVHNKSALDN